jgi:hypothetical protein
MTNFPALDIRDKPQPPKASRVLVIKPKQTRKVVGASSGSKKSTNVWDKVASAAIVATAVSGPSSAQSSTRSSPQSSRPSSPSNTFRTPSKTPWSGSSTSNTTGSSKNISSSANDFPSLKPKAFPSLPSAAPKHNLILNMRRTASGQQINNAWGGASSEEGGESSAAEDSYSSANPSKKKGRKNKVLFRVGL